MLRLFKDARYDFLGVRRYAYAATVAVAVPGFALLAARGLNESIEFTGGTLIQLKTAESVQAAQLRQGLTQQGILGAEIQSFGGPGEYVVRVRLSKPGVDPNDTQATAAEVRRALDQVLGQNTFSIERTEAVGPKVGGELRRQAFLAIFLSFFAVLAYLAYRFEWRFGLAAVAAVAERAVGGNFDDVAVAESRAERFGASWPDVIDRLRADHPAPDALVDAYARAMADARDFVAQHRLAAIPDAPLRVVPTPAFMRPLVPFAAYDAPGPYAGDRTGWFYVTVPDGDLSVAARERLLRDHCRHELAATALHEGFPGHHLQIAIAQELTKSGIKTKANLHDATRMNQLNLGMQLTGLMFASWGNWMFDIDNIYVPLFHSTSVKEINQGKGQSDRSWSTPEFDKMLEEARVELDEEKRQAMNDKIHR